MRIPLVFVAALVFLPAHVFSSGLPAGETSVAIGYAGIREAMAALVTEVVEPARAKSIRESQQKLKLLSRRVEDLRSQSIAGSPELLLAVKALRQERLVASNLLRNAIEQTPELKEQLRDVRQQAVMRRSADLLATSRAQRTKVAERLEKMRYINILRKLNDRRAVVQERIRARRLDLLSDA